MLGHGCQRREPQDCRGVPDTDTWETATRRVNGRPMMRAWVNIDGQGWQEMWLDRTLGEMWLWKKEHLQVERAKGLR